MRALTTVLAGVPPSPGDRRGKLSSMRRSKGSSKRSEQLQAGASDRF